MSTQASVSLDRWEARTSRREEERVRLRQLDACLEQLERAHEQDHATVSEAIASAVAKHVPAVEPGMQITRAIELVMRDQEPYLAYNAVPDPTPQPAVRDLPTFRRQSGACTGAPPRWPTLVASQPSPSVGAGPERADPHDHRAEVPLEVDSRPGGAPMRAELTGPGMDADASDTSMDEIRARELTHLIKSAAENAGRLCSLLLEAHDRRAWSVLGYSSWEGYVRTEFQLSRTRSYELLDHGRVIRAIEAATGVSGIPNISPYAASQIKPRLADVVATIRSRVAGVPPDRVRDVADEVVREVRSHVIDRRNTLRNAASAQRRGDVVSPASEHILSVNGATRPNGAHHHVEDVDLTAFYDAVRTLARMPPVGHTISLIPPDHQRRLADLTCAARWLAEFAEQWSRTARHAADVATVHDAFPPEPMADGRWPTQ